MGEQSNLQVKFSWESIITAVECLGYELAQMPNLEGIVAVARGGTIPGVMLSHFLKRPLLYINASSYTKDRVQGDLVVDIPSATLRALHGAPKNYVIIDDVVDTGVTYKQISSLYPNTPFACIVSKRPTLPVLSFAQTAPNVWVKFPWEL